ncbi:formate dehydrogenase subunit alpha [Sphaerisporangium sp. TRM90804]|uniref:formate dehydrogenase subunit alpha n=1 Tax=Sphaerisporangium sp. TRM90804 TaxID=3031113 RepID=UPI002449A120|nr:formate dehydrogenase subunit alpha [Sphaerisporangium sp. TRM90804]MDH2430820.1 formate dehydrogenase subunit alpha [Sphaerisporangium sp. TRM90804]
MRVHVDGVPVTVPEGASLLEAVRSAGVELPSLCHDDRLTPAGSCRTCLVRTGGNTVAACVIPAADGMSVEVTGEGLVALRREAVELIVSALPPSALDGGAEGTELARLCHALGVTPGQAREEGVRGRDESHPYVHLDPDLCIACGRCVRMCAEVQGTFALTLTGRGADTVVTPGTGGAWADSDCVACGGCVDTCPTGALTEPGMPVGASRTAPVRTRTTCGYCGVGCSLEVLTRDGEIAAVLPDREGPVNRGHACVKGRFAHGFVRAPDRLTRPLLRRRGGFEPVSWAEALAHVARGMRAAVAEGGPDAVAAISSARATNEENYLVQKFMRVVIGSNNVDNCSRLCHSPSAAGLTASFGLPGGTDVFEEAEKADCLLVVGANPAEAHPVVGARLFQKVLRGARLVVADPRAVGLAEYADVHLRPRPGTNVALFHGLAHILLAEGLADRDFLRDHAAGMTELAELLAGYPPERVAAITGIPAEDLVAAARLYGRAERPAIFYGLGVTEHLHGTDGVRTLANLAIIRGAAGPGRGYGVNPLRGQNNVQGASDMGALPDVLPGYQKVGDPAARARAAAVWGVPVPERPGLRIPEMFAAARSGELRALWVIGEDVCATDPDADRVAEALEACPLVVCNELFLSETARRADVVLPVASWLEKDGTFVNFDRRFQRVRPALVPPGEARTDFATVHALAAALGVDLRCRTPAETLAECGKVAPVFAGVTHERLDREGATPWPCPDLDAPGEARLYPQRFATPDGLAHLACPPYLPPGEEPDDRYPLILVTGRRWAHYNSGGMTRRTGNLRLGDVDLLDLHPADAARHGLRDGDRVVVESRHGRARLVARLTDQTSPGQAFCAFHFPSSGVNTLTSAHADTVTACPEYKVTAVRVSRRPRVRSPAGGRTP